MGSKIISIVLLLMLIGAAFGAYYFYDQNQKLLKDKSDLTLQIQKANDEYGKLKEKADRLGKDKAAADAQLAEAQNENQNLKQTAATLQDKYNTVSQEREKIRKQLDEAKTQVKTVYVDKPAQASVQPAGTSDEYWADVVKARAALEVKLEAINKELADTKNVFGDLEQKNKELSLKIDELTKQLTDREVSLKSNQRMVDVVSRDLVNERESRKKIEDEFEKVRKENLGLKREVVLVGKEKGDLANKITELEKSKVSLEQRIMNIDGILKEKSMALQEIQDQLSVALKGGEAVPGSSQAAPVNLPPIVVKPESSGVSGIKAEVISINKEDNFVVVDAGSDSAVTPGASLKVMRGDQQIGTVQVIEVRKEISAAEIKEVASGFEIKQGDIAVSK